MAVVLTRLPDYVPSELNDLLSSHGANMHVRLPTILRDDLNETQAKELTSILRLHGAEVELWSTHDAGAPEPTAKGNGPDDPLRVIRPQPEDTYVLLLAPGDKKIQVIKEVRSYTQLGLKEAKDLVDGAPSIVGKWTRSAASEACTALISAGATAELIGNSNEEGTSLFDVYITSLRVDSTKPDDERLVTLIRDMKLPTIIKSATLVSADLAAYIAEDIADLVTRHGGRAEVWPAPSAEGPLR